jgi:intracellular septation protein
VLYLVFAAGLLCAQRVFGRNPMQAMMGAHLVLPDQVWKKVTFAWAGFFGLLAGLNVYVAQHFSTDAWVNFKLFGVTGLMLAFVFVQALFLARHAEAHETTDKDVS